MNIQFEVIFIGQIQLTKESWLAVAGFEMFSLVVILYFGNGIGISEVT